MCYIELNPVRAGMVTHAQDYPWSSYAANADGEENRILTEHPICRQLSADAAERQSAYRQLLQVDITKADLEALRRATYKIGVLGDGRFREKIEGLANRRTTAKARGRPEKPRIEM